MKVQTNRARRVLSDAKEALLKFNTEPTDVDFRHLVVLCTVLIRAVGHVLESENQYNKSAKELCATYYKNNIAVDELFITFIKSTRDSAIKEYTTYVTWESITTLDKKHRMQYLFKNGQNDGEDFIRLMQSSVEFWERHLGVIEMMSLAEG
jgi:hypothetical protein